MQPSLTGLRRGHVSSLRSDPQRSVAYLYANGVPPTVAIRTAQISQVILLTQFVGNAGRRGVEVTRIAHDLCATTAVIRDVAQGGDVHAFVAHTRSLVGRFVGRRRRGWPRHARDRWVPWWRPPARHRKRQRDRSSTLLPNDPAVAAQGRERYLRIDADRIHQRFGLPDQLLQCLKIDPAVRVVAIRDDEQRPSCGADLTGGAGEPRPRHRRGL